MEPRPLRREPRPPGFPPPPAWSSSGRASRRGRAAGQRAADQHFQLRAWLHQLLREHIRLSEPGHENLAIGGAVAIIGDDDRSIGRLEPIGIGDARPLVEDEAALPRESLAGARYSRSAARARGRPLFQAPPQNLWVTMPVRTGLCPRAARFLEAWHRHVDAPFRLCLCRLAERAVARHE